MDSLESNSTILPVQSSLPTAEINSIEPWNIDFSNDFQLFASSDDSLTTDLVGNYEELLADFDPNGFFSDINGLSAYGTAEESDSTESNDVANLIQCSDEQLAMIKPNSTPTSTVRPVEEKALAKVRPVPSITLSESVAVTVPKPNQLRISLPLEETYKPRYKSDYYPQSGAVRPPRYVADIKGNHYITLQMPSECTHDLAGQHICIALITTAIENGSPYYSPYKFQTSNYDAKVPDQNPIFIPVDLQKGSDSMKLQLVLIKSKLDQLAAAQPLKSFANTKDNPLNNSHWDKLSPKDLIKRYQLEKAQLAFTLCTKLSNGTYTMHPETTVFSSVISEATAKRANEPKAKPAAVPQTPAKRVSCPNCKHCFDPSESLPVEENAGQNSEASASSATVTKTVGKSKAKRMKLA